MLLCVCLLFLSIYILLILRFFYKNSHKRCPLVGAKKKKKTSTAKLVAVVYTV